jgi:hypothetical protein
MIVFPDDERQAVKKSCKKSLEEEIQRICTETQNRVMIIVYDDESGHLQGECRPTSLEKEVTEKDI